MKYKEAVPTQIIVTHSHSYFVSCSDEGIPSMNVSGGKVYAFMPSGYQFNALWTAVDFVRL